MIAPSATSQNWGEEKEEEFLKILQLETPLSAVWNKELPWYPRYYLENVCIAAGSMVFVFVHKAFLCPTLQDLSFIQFYWWKHAVVIQGELWPDNLCMCSVCAMEVSVVVPVPFPPPLSSLLLSKNSIEVSTRLLNW